MRDNQAYFISEKIIVKGLRDLGIRYGDRVLVHSSLSKFGYVEGGAKSVVSALLLAIGPEGSLLAPTLTGAPEDGPVCPPRFDVQSTPSWTGRIAETVRQWPGAMRSLGPTHSIAAVGPDSRRLLAGHEDCRTPCGDGSPYVKLADAGGKIIFLGVTLDANTSFHAAEELAGVPYHLQTVPTRCRILNEEGRELERECVLHRWDTERRFAEMEEVLYAKRVLHRGQIGAAKTLIVESKPMLDFTIDLLRKDPWSLTKRGERQFSC